MIALPPRPIRFGFAEHFRVGERERAERALREMRELGVRDLRLLVSWADHLTAEGEPFYDWLIPRLASEVRLVPCITHTPPSLGVEPRCSAPPKSGRALSEWLDVFLTQHGASFDSVELWNAPNALAGWDARLDPDLLAFAATVGGAASGARERGKTTVLGGLCPADPSFLRRLADLGVLSLFDAIAIHARPELSEPDWIDWKRPVAQIRAALVELGCSAEVWISEGRLLDLAPRRGAADPGAARRDGVGGGPGLLARAARSAGERHGAERVPRGRARVLLRPRARRRHAEAGLSTLGRGRARSSSGALALRAAAAAAAQQAAHEPGDGAARASSAATSRTRSCPAARR
ncbi:MAG: hypothetical protein M5U28_34520 [Sandaracinaceae bacterium]|nr:hypothetical protein [Sandaracinaceae bacterium]